MIFFCVSFLISKAKKVGEISVFVLHGWANANIWPKESKTGQTKGIDVRFGRMSEVGHPWCRSSTPKNISAAAYFVLKGGKILVGSRVSFLKAEKY